jgi:hypothetical protein
MKKFILFMSCAIAMSVSLASCSDDNDDDETEIEDVTTPTGTSSDSKSACVYTTSDGNQIVVSSVKADKTANFTYNSDGLITTERYTGATNYWTIDYSADRIYFSKTWDWTYSTNSAGYVTKMECQSNGENYTVTLSYSDNYLTKIEQKMTGDGYNETTSIKLTWSNKAIKKISFLYETSSDGTESNFDMTFGSTTETNTLGQYDYIMSTIVENWISAPGALWLSGLLGKAPAYLPTSYTINDYAYDSTGTGTITYKFNSNKSIASESWKEVMDGETDTNNYIFSYSDFATAAKKAPAISRAADDEDVVSVETAEEHHGLFFTRRPRH